jgi:hypothetical protein
MAPFAGSRATSAPCTAGIWASVQPASSPPRIRAGFEHRGRHQAAGDGALGERRIQRFLVTEYGLVEPRLGAAPLVAPVVSEQGPAQGAVGETLALAVDGGDDLVAVGIGGLAVAVEHLLAHHLGDIVRGITLIGARLDHLNRLGQRPFVLVGVDHALGQHAREHVVAPRPGALGIDGGIVVRRRLR